MIRRALFVSGQIAVIACSASAMAQGAVDRPSAESKTVTNGESPGPGAVTAHAVREAIEQAVEQLVADAQLLDQHNREGRSPHQARPHPAIQDWDDAMTRPILDRMLEPFTGNVYRDTYIRWHLMWVVNRTPKSRYSAMAKSFRRLFDKMPPPLAKPLMAIFTYEPPEVWHEYRSLVEAGNVVVGIPPFEKKYGPPESFGFMTDEKREAVERKLAEAESLRDKFVSRYLPEAAAYNKRIKFVNWVVRRYRGELINALIWTGDGAMMRRMFKAIDRLARDQDGSAHDLVNYLYIAAFDGAFTQYDAKLREQLSRQLKATAMDVEGWTSYGGQQRNFADYVFHLIYLLAEDVSYDDGPQQPQEVVTP